MVGIYLNPEMWSDFKFQNFLVKLGNRHTAMGLVVDMWILAQRYWIPNKQLIPYDQWKESGLPEYLVDCKLAIATEDGIYVCECEEKFQWYFDNMDKFRRMGSRGGQKSALRPRDAKGRLLPKRTLGFIQAEPKRIQAESKRTLGQDETQAESKRVQAYAWTDPSVRLDKTSKRSPSVRLDLSKRSQALSYSSSSSSFKKEKKKEKGITQEYLTIFERLWYLYGRVGDKKLSYSEFQDLNLEPDDLVNLSEAIRQYKIHKPDVSFRWNFERFLAADWRQFLPEKKTQLEPPKPEDEEPLVDPEKIRKILESRGF